MNLSLKISFVRKITRRRRTHNCDIPRWGLCWVNPSSICVIQYVHRVCFHNNGSPFASHIIVRHRLRLNQSFKSIVMILLPPRQSKVGTLVSSFYLELHPISIFSIWISFTSFAFSLAGDDGASCTFVESFWSIKRLDSFLSFRNLCRRKLAGNVVWCDAVCSLYL